MRYPGTGRGGEEGSFVSRVPEYAIRISSDFESFLVQANSPVGVASEERLVWV